MDQQKCVASSSYSEDTLETFIAEEGGNDIKEVSCEKNPGHVNFIPVIDFKLDNLPVEHQNEERLKTIFSWAELIVKIKVKYVSMDRPETFSGSKALFPNYRFRGSFRKISYGSGYVFSETNIGDLEDLDKAKCHCLLCQNSEGTVDVQSWYFTVLTSIHVIYDSKEAERSTFECFYDSNDKSSHCTQYLYGIKMYQQIQRDKEKMAYVICVTHDKELAEKLQSLIKVRNEILIRNDSSTSGPAILISHPHGCSKTITIGHVLHLTIPTGDEYPMNKPVLFEEETECILPYSSLSEVPVLDFVQAFGLNQQSSNDIDLPSQDDVHSNMTDLSNQTDTLTLDPSSLEECQPQTNCSNPHTFSLTPTSRDNDCSNQNPDNLKLHSTGPETVSDVTPISNLGMCGADSETTNVSNSSVPLSLDEEFTTEGKNSLPSEDRSVDDNSNVHDGKEPFVVYYVDGSPDENATVNIPNIPDPDHLLSLTLPPKMTFTLPESAEFARRYNDMKSLFHFPPGTKFQLANGKEVYLPPDAQFYSNKYSVQYGYTSYKVDSCPSSSGGCMLLDGGNSFLHTFPHAGSLAGGVSMCGLRCYPIFPSNV